MCDRKKRDAAIWGKRSFVSEEPCLQGCTRQESIQTRERLIGNTRPGSRRGVLWGPVWSCQSILWCRAPDLFTGPKLIPSVTCCNTCATICWMCAPLDDIQEQPAIPMPQLKVHYCSAWVCERSSERPICLVGTPGQEPKATPTFIIPHDLAAP